MLAKYSIQAFLKTIKVKIFSYRAAPFFTHRRAAKDELCCLRIRCVNSARAVVLSSCGEYCCFHRCIAVHVRVAFRKEVHICSNRSLRMLMSSWLFRTAFLLVSLKITLPFAALIPFFHIARQSILSQFCCVLKCSFPKTFECFKYYRRLLISENIFFAAWTMLNPWSYKASLDVFAFCKTGWRPAPYLTHLQIILGQLQSRDF